MSDRVLIIIIAPFAIVWAFASTLCREIGHAFWFAWNAVEQEAHDVRRAWRAKSINSRDW